MTESLKPDNPDEAAKEMRRVVEVAGQTVRITRKHRSSKRRGVKTKRRK
jgi:hypothetical protein